MNNTRRKLIVKIIEDLEDLQGRLEEVRDEEEEYKDSIPEPFTEKKEKAENICDQLNVAYDSISEVLESLMNLED